MTTAAKIYFTDFFEVVPEVLEAMARSISP